MKLYKFVYFSFLLFIFFTLEFCYSGLDSHSDNTSNFSSSNQDTAFLEILDSLQKSLSTSNKNIELSSSYSSNSLSSYSLSHSSSSSLYYNDDFPY